MRPAEWMACIVLAGVVGSAVGLAFDAPKAGFFIALACVLWFPWLMAEMSLWDWVQKRCMWVITSIFQGFWWGALFSIILMFLAGLSFYMGDAP